MDKEKFNLLQEKISPTFCMAKFHEATIWLYSSKIAGCHHTPLFPTGIDKLTFFNNPAKRSQQFLMIEGKKPSECGYCWKLEEKGLTSDRELKSLYFKNHLDLEHYLDTGYNFKPKALELAFQNTCNLACAYCSPSFSTEWINDIKKNGMYQNITTDIKRHYSRGIDDNVPVDMVMFWEWFDEISSDLESIRITGGEPLLHEETFKTFEKMISINPNVECVIHTNLCQKSTIIDRFISFVNKLNDVRINISNESSGEVAEFIRDGMVYNSWLDNVERLINETDANVSISTTVTALSLVGLDDLYRDIIKVRKNKSFPYVSINFATYPVFQSFCCLSREDREFYQKKYLNLFEEIKDQMLDLELKSFPRLISMLEPDLVDENHINYKKDSNNFFSQYSIRRKKSFDFSTLIGKK
jgi:MoaA/NifB/PqqE/SkfB family radical SAM enzyme